MKNSVFICKTFAVSFMAMVFAASVLHAQAQEPAKSVALTDKGTVLVKSLGEQIDKQALASDKVKQLAKEVLLPLSANETLIAAVKEQNAKKTSLEDIKKIDEQWMKAEDQLPIQKELLESKCAKEIVAIVKKNPAIVEAFVMDNQGAVVGENNLTSDYWQGDEPKWKESFNETKGGVNVAKVTLDKSSNAQLQQVSLPIIDADGTVLGAVTYGIAVEKL